MHRIGIDLGGTKIEGLHLDPHHKVLERKRVATNREEGYTSIVGRIVELVNQFTRGLSSPYTVGICTPGVISASTGRLKNSNTVCLIGEPLKEDLEAGLGHNITMENDANCFALAEATLGVAREYRIVFGVIMGTGVGGGIVIDKLIHRGPNHIAGEWGHHSIDPQGPECYCGRRGCVETFLSGPALERHWKTLSGQQIPLKEIVQLARSDTNPTITRWKRDFLQTFGLALGNVIDVLDPDAIVLGGGVSNIPFLYREGTQAVYRQVFSDEVTTPILKPQLGDSAGVFGAALLEKKP